MEDDVYTKEHKGEMLSKAVGKEDYGVMFDVFNEYYNDNKHMLIDDNIRSSIKNFLRKVEVVKNKYF